MSEPNLFNWATSELSQDAFICWLLSWANYPDNEPLFKTAKYLINKLTDNKIDNFKEVEVVRQRYKIDILCIIDKKNAILIEDKTNTSDRPNQLENYLQKLSKDFSQENIFPIYFKTGDQSNYQSINKAGYKLFLRPDFLEILKFGKEQNISNAIFNDFNEYLNNIENSVQSYKLLPVKNWHWNSWKGFYSALQKQLNDGNWDYVPQKNGGFLGFCWYRLRKEFDSVKFDYYLQLEHNKFCFKLYPYKRDKAELIRNHYRQLLYKKAKEHNINLYQNGRVGNYMTVAALKDNYISVDENGIIDMDKTVQTLKKIQNMLKAI